MTLDQRKRPAVRIATELAGLVRECRVELIALGLAIACATLLARGNYPALQQWDATAFALLVSALWMAICIVIYRVLLRTSR